MQNKTVIQAQMSWAWTESSGPSGVLVPLNQRVLYACTSVAKSERTDPVIVLQQSRRVKRKHLRLVIVRSRKLGTPSRNPRWPVESPRDRAIDIIKGVTMDISVKSQVNQKDNEE